MKNRSAATAAFLIAILSIGLATLSCSRTEQTTRVQVDSLNGRQGAKSNDAGSTKMPKVTFVELGSDRCVPCIMMREVMEQVENRYGEQVRIVFHDVWTPEGEPYARQFRIRVIPTQVFLDAQGQEYFRHEGYFPFTELVEILALKGVR